MHLLRALLLLACAVSLVVLPGAAVAASPPTTVLFVGGYGSDLATVGDAFAPLRAALAARDPNTKFAQYSYNGWNGQACAPLDYQSVDTGQDFATSEKRLLDTVYLLHAQCGAERIAVVGHSLGGLIAFHALSDSPMGEVTDVVTIDSPLGGAPPSVIRTCVDAGFCADGPVTGALSDLYTQWDQTAQANATRVNELAAAHIRVTAWGNQGDCLYAPSRCVPLAGYVLGRFDARDTQWLGVDRAMRRDYAAGKSSLVSVFDSHELILSAAAADIAADLLA
jgi:pimeloyl-ACP methyl ester carboxylesterase